MLGGVAVGERAGSAGREGGVVRLCCALSSARDGLVREVVLVLRWCWGVGRRASCAGKGGGW